MSEKKKREKAAAILRIKPSAEAIAWAKGSHGDDWRTSVEDDLETTLECWALGGVDVYLNPEVLSDLEAAEKEHVRHRAIAAARDAADELRKEKWLAVLANYSPELAALANYSPDELRAVLAGLDGIALDDACDDCGADERDDADPDDYDEADELPPESRWAAAKERATGGEA